MNICTSSFRPSEMIGGGVGIVIMQGVRRGFFQMRLEVEILTMQQQW